jgi:DNA-binding transcriptional MerR regulator
MYLIRQLASKYNLTRTSLLHYDAIGLLCPSARTEAGYRLYSAEDEKKLGSILLFRSMGIPLENIKHLLGTDKSRLANALLLRLDELNREIGALKQKQKNIVTLFQDLKTLEDFIGQMNSDPENRMLFNDIHLLEWHEQFEATSPDLHKEFLELLESIPDDMKASIQASLESLPEKERGRINWLIAKNLA